MRIRRKLQKAAVLLIILICSAAPAFSYPFSTYNHSENPVFLSVDYGGMEREYFESGFSNSLTAGSSYFNFPGIFLNGSLLDLDQMSVDLEGDPLKVFMLGSSEFHSTISILDISLGGYLNIDAAVSPELPYGIVDVFANGIDFESDETELVSYTGEASVYGRAFVKSGIYFGYQAENWVAGVKTGPYVPVLYTDPDSSYMYSLSADAEAALEAVLNGNFSAYSPYDYNNLPDFTGDTVISLFKDIAGYNLDLGFTWLKDDKPLWGVGLTGITLFPATLNYSTSITVDASAAVNALASFSDSDMFSSDSADPEFTSSDSAAYAVYLPLRFGGFYRFDVFGAADIITSAGLCYDSGELLPDFNVGAIFPAFPLVYGNIGYQDALWRGNFGLKLDLRVIEFGFDLGTVSPKFSTFFNAPGVYLSMYSSIGF